MATRALAVQANSIPGSTRIRARLARMGDEEGCSTARSWQFIYTYAAQIGESISASGWLAEGPRIMPRCRSNNSTEAMSTPPANHVESFIKEPLRRSRRWWAMCGPRLFGGRFGQLPSAPRNPEGPHKDASPGLLQLQARSARPQNWPCGLLLGSVSSRRPFWACAMPPTRSIGANADGQALRKVVC